MFSSSTIGRGSKNDTYILWAVEYLLFMGLENQEFIDISDTLFDHWSIAAKRGFPLRIARKKKLDLMLKRKGISGGRGPPTEVWFKMNVDTAFKDGKAAILGVLRNYWGEALCAYGMMVDCVDSMHGEALAILTAILFCVEIDYLKMTIEGDNESLILLVKGLVKGDNERLSTNATENIIKDIRKELSAHKFINVEHAFREENLLTHNIADYVLSISIGCI